MKITRNMAVRVTCLKKPTLIDKENKGKSSTGNYMEGRTQEKQWESCIFVT